MLNSIKRHMALAGMTERKISETSKLPNMAAMISDLGYKRLMYVVGQRLGSHHIHGTWPSLLTHYLEEKDGSLRLRDHDCDAHPNQFVMVPLLVLSAIAAYIDFIFVSKEDSEPIKELLDSVKKEICNINTKMSGGGGISMPKWESNKSLQVMIDQPPIFAVTKAGVASNAPLRGG